MKITPRAALFALSLSPLLACSGQPDVAGEDLSSDEAEFRSLRVKVVGGLAYGETSQPVAYDRWAARTLGFTFSGGAGDRVEISVRAANEDAFVWLLDDHGRVVASDTASGPIDGHVGHVVTVLPRAGTFTIAFREAHFECADVVVALAGTPACVAKSCASVGALCGSLDDGCGGTLACGTCTGADTCGGGGVANVCGHPPPPVCTWKSQFERTYGQPWNPADVSFVTADGVEHRAMSSLDLEASRNQVPDIVRTLGSSSKVTTIRLRGAGGAVLASRDGAYIYGLGDAMWHQVNGWEAADLVETTLVRVFTEPQRSYAELTDAFERLTIDNEALAPAEDRLDFREAARQVIADIRAGRASFKLGTGHAIDFGQTRRTVNGKTFSLQFSNAFALDPKIGMQRNGVWLFWPSLPQAPTCP